MIQNLIALIIVFAAAGYTAFSVFKNITAKKVSACGGGCSGCSFKDLPLNSGVKTKNTMNKAQTSKLEIGLVRSTYEPHPGSS